jgi:hypothetical protein
LLREQEVPNKLGYTALELLRDSLARGLIRELVRRGGSERRSYLSGGTVKHGRLWERHAPPQLVLSDYPYHLLRWMTATPLRSPRAEPLLVRPETPADELFAFLAADLLFKCEIPFDLTFGTATLISLGFPERVTSAPPADFMTCALFIEAMQPWLARRWTELLLGISEIQSIEVLERRATQLGAVLEQFLSSIERANRPDLAHFYLAASANALSRRHRPEDFFAALEKKGVLEDQLGHRRRTFFFLSAIEELRSFADRARAVRFFDEEYDAAQLYLKYWELVGDARLATAINLREQGSRP